MIRFKQFKFVLSALTLLVSISGYGQYKYTRFSVDINAGPSLPLTSIPGALSGYSEIGIKGTLSYYLALRAAGGYGFAHGERSVNRMQGAREEVINYTKFRTSYYYFNGSAYFNLDRMLKLRQSMGMFKRLNPFLVVGSGIMFPDVKVNRYDGQFKNYKRDVRFVTHNFGLDFRHFLSNRFDLTFGAEYIMVQSYYFDGAYSDQKLDGLVNAHIGISYNIGASADRKSMDWYNLDGQRDIIFAPEDEKEIPEPISENPPKDTAQTVAAAVSDIHPEEEQPVSADTALASPDVRAIVSDMNLPKDTAPVYIEHFKPNESNTQASGTAPYKKVGRHVDIRPNGTEQAARPVSPDRETASPDQADDAKPAQQQPTAETASAPGSLNDIDGVVRPLGRYNVIVGTYAGSRYAVLFRNKLRRQGFEAALFKSSDHSKMVRVAVYYGDDRAEALRQLNNYRKKFNNQAWIHVYNGR